MNLDYSQVVHDDGRSAGVIAIVVETPGKVRAEQRLSGEHQRLAQMFDEAPGFMALQISRRSQKMDAIEVRRFDAPDDAIDMKGAGGISIIKMADGTTGMRALFEPGSTWEKNEKPLLGSPPTCPMRHTGYCIAGNLWSGWLNRTRRPASPAANSSRFRLGMMRMWTAPNVSS